MDDKKTMTAEEVENDRMAVAETLGGYLAERERLSRLAAQAARVPGLEKQVGDLADKAAATFTAATETRKRLETRAEKAESERDAARKEAAELAKVAEQRLAERNATEAEAEVLRERVATLEAQVESLTACEQGADAVAKEALAAQRTAEARVKELESRLSEAQDRIAELAAQERTARERADAWEAEALKHPQPPPAPSEEPVKCKDCGREDGDGGHIVNPCHGCNEEVCGDCTDPTTPDEVRVCADCFAEGNYGQPPPAPGPRKGPCGHCDARDHRIQERPGAWTICEACGPVTPPPAPAQGRWAKSGTGTVLHYFIGSRSVCGRNAPGGDWAPGLLHGGICERCLRGAPGHPEQGDAPTPPPGLREAAGPNTVCLHCGQRRAEHIRRHHGDGPKGTLWYCRTASERPFTPRPASLDAAVRAALSGPLAWMIGPDSDWRDGEVGVGHGFRAQAHEAQSLLAAGLAAYDATGGSTVHPRLVQAQVDAAGALLLDVQQECIKQRQRADANAEDAAKYRAAVERHNRSTFCADVWATLPGRKGWERGAQADAHFEAAAAYLLGLTLETPPSGPGGGERSQEEVDSDFAQWQAEQPTRARIAPTPTPEVPPLKVAGIPIVADTSVPEGEAHLRTDNKTVARIVNVESTAPAVVWQGDGLKVKADGSVWDTHEHRAPWQVTELLARALAEAKREVAEAAQQAIRRFASRLGDDATGHDTDRSLEELEVALYQHVMEEEDKARTQAAESMRERAKQAILKQLAEEEEDGLSSDDRGYSALMIRRLADAVGKLPLE